MQNAAIQPITVTAVHTAAAASVQTAADSDLHFSFDDLLDIVNPLQHLPVVGTLYRAITGDHIKTPEKIAGDTLYGGLWGFVSSVADTAFASLTGKNFGDTVLALLTGDHNAKPTSVAKATNPTPPAESTPAPPVPAAAAPPVNSDVAALSASLSRTGANNEMAQRALYAYRRAYMLTSGSELSPF